MASPHNPVPRPFPTRPLLWLFALLAGLAQMALRHRAWAILLLIAASVLTTVAGRIRPTLDEQNVKARTDDEGDGQD